MVDFCFTSDWFKKDVARLFQRMTYGSLEAKQKARETRAHTSWLTFVSLLIGLKRTSLDCFSESRMVAKRQNKKRGKHARTPHG